MESRAGNATLASYDDRIVAVLRAAHPARLHAREIATKLGEPVLRVQSALDRLYDQHRATSRGGLYTLTAQEIAAGGAG